MRRIILVVFLALSTAAAYGQQQQKSATTTATPATSTAEVTATAETAATTTDADSHSTRERFRELLSRMPPQVGVVLKLDPTLFNNQQFMATYPVLADFVAKHPDITHNPSFYLSNVYLPTEDPRSASQKMWQEVLEGIFIFAIMTTIIWVFVWLIRTMIEQRRWSRLARVQTEVHTKMLDRFSTSDELLRYIDTPAGKRFLESAPIPVDTAAAKPQIAAPVGRILWSIQTGLVAAAAGIGLLFVGGSNPDAQPLRALGVVALCVGIGFVVSAVVSFVLSRRLHLIELPEPQGPANV